MTVSKRIGKFVQQRTVLLLVLTALVLAALACRNGVGSCVASGGDILLAPECKQGWSRAECKEWDREEINGANWDFKSRSCESQGFTEECSDGSFRYPGDC